MLIFSTGDNTMLFRVANAPDPEEGLPCDFVMHQQLKGGVISVSKMRLCMDFEEQNLIIPKKCVLGILGVAA